MSDIKVKTTEWISVSSLSGIEVGSLMKLQNKGTTELLIQESATKPSDTDTSGEVMTTLSGVEPSKVVTEDGEEVWARIRQPKTGTIILSVQEWKI